MKSVFLIYLLCFPLFFFGQGVLNLEMMRAENEFGLYDSVLAKQHKASVPDEFVEIAKAFYLKQDYTSALEWAQKSNSLPDAQLLLAKIYSIQGNADSACFCLTSYLGNQNKISRTRIMLDDVFTSLQRTACWKMLWRNDWYGDDETAEYQAMLERKEFDALLAYLYAKERSSRNKYATFEARALWGLGQPNDAYKALADVRDSAGLRLKWQLELFLGKHGKSYETAVLCAKKNRERAEPLKMIATSALYAGLYAEAQSAISQYLDVYYMDPEGLCLAGSIALAEGRFLDVYRFTNTALQFAPACAEARKVRGNAFYEQQNWEFAKKEYLLFLDLRGLEPVVMEKLGVAYIKVGAVDDGCSELKRAFALNAPQASDFLRKYCKK